MVSRREFVAGAAGAISAAVAPNVAFGQGSGQGRLVFILQRGAADGLSILAPVGDRLFRQQRGLLGEEFVSIPTLDGMFALHPALDNLARLYRNGQALLAHAVALSSSTGSHCEAQHTLVSGGRRAFDRSDSWIARLAALLPNDPRTSVAMISRSTAAESRADSSCGLPLDAARSHHLWVPDAPATCFVPALAGVEKLAIAAGPPEADARTRGVSFGAFIASRLRSVDGPRIAMVETDGWDTHDDQKSRLGTLLPNLDGMIGAIEAGLGPLWHNTVVVVATEFGRAIRPNSSGGTDHGTASVAMLLGGGVRGGRVISDWPGLALRTDRENDGLRGTLELERLLASAAAASLNFDPEFAMRTMFPAMRAQAVENIFYS